ncbi:rRNA maturation RNase YbeY [Halomonas campisalis]|uniref:Endoribonuclease YbeY n=1 Tax=Billgrantia campisalis TaxID=74661 RepID=A0ABS9PBX8_9GAMM|nr:rRNA maturation RNase YbeY [Halomonas campisalis]MCG6658732.1 rRNA maturation RNase YbeY [Halomonas campisalis]MDR5864886.1 rRNA maturation RNase YbeY [Halomonas campisalis]
MTPGPVIDRQVAITDTGLPSQAALAAWVAAALARQPDDPRREVTVRFVDAEESRTLNRTYRGKDKPTNVLSFPFECPPGLTLPLLGDLVICHRVVVDEAQAQDKRLEDHYAHLVVHGTLHLLGHDHLEDDEAESMEQLEREILADFGIADPYAAPDSEGGERHSDTEDR